MALDTLSLEGRPPSLSLPSMLSVDSLGAPFLTGSDPPSAPNEIGVLGPYRIVAELGRGSGYALTVRPACSPVRCIRSRRADIGRGNRGPSLLDSPE